MCSLEAFVFPPQLNGRAFGGALKKVMTPQGVIRSRSAQRRRRTTGVFAAWVVLLALLFVGSMDLLSRRTIPESIGEGFLAAFAIIAFPMGLPALVGLHKTFPGWVWAYVAVYWGTIVTCHAVFAVSGRWTWFWSPVVLMCVTFAGWVRLDTLP